MISNENSLGRKSLHINQESQCKKKKLKSKPKTFRSKKAYFSGHPVIQPVEAEMLGPFKIFVF